MLHTTFAKAKEAGACTDVYRKVADALGGITTYSRDTPIGLDKVLEIAGLDAALWGLGCTIEPADKLAGTFACDCADRVLVKFERVYPDDKRPRLAIEASRKYLKGEIAKEEIESAWSAAWSAESAARSAAESAWSARWAAWSAAWSDEIEWQTKHLLDLLQEC